MITYSSNRALIIDVAVMKLLIGPRFHNGENVIRWQHKGINRVRTWSPFTLVQHESMYHTYVEDTLTSLQELTVKSDSCILT